MMGGNGTFFHKIRVWASTDDCSFSKSSMRNWLRERADSNGTLLIVAVDARVRAECQLKTEGCSSQKEESCNVSKAFTFFAVHF